MLACIKSTCLGISIRPSRFVVTGVGHPTPPRPRPILIFWNAEAGGFMKSIAMVRVALGTLGGMAAWGQIPSPAGLKSGPGVQAANDSKDPDVLKTCKVPPTPRGGRPPGARPAPPPPGPKDYTVTEIP